MKDKTSQNIFFFEIAKQNISHNIQLIGGIEPVFEFNETISPKGSLLYSLINKYFFKRDLGSFFNYVKMNYFI